MQEIIEALKRAVQNKDRFRETLSNDKHYAYHENYPVAVVHHKRRIKEPETLQRLEAAGFVDDGGYTPSVYTPEEIENMRSCAPKYVKNVSFLCMAYSTPKHFVYKEKRAGDYWKKIVNPETFRAVIEYSVYSNNEDICTIEFELRERMRSSKEVPSLKLLPFITVIRTSKGVDLAKLMKHYFGQHYICMDDGAESMAIGWSTTLQEVNMRHFVCNPK